MNEQKLQARLNKSLDLTDKALELLAKTIKEIKHGTKKRRKDKQPN